MAEKEEETCDIQYSDDKDVWMSHESDIEEDKEQNDERERESDQDKERSERHKRSHCQRSRSPASSSKKWRYYSKSRSRSWSPSADSFGRSKRRESKFGEEDEDNPVEPGIKNEEIEKQSKIHRKKKRVEEELVKRKIDVDEEVMRKIEEAKKHVEHRLEGQYERRTKEVEKQFKGKEINKKPMPEEVPHLHYLQLVGYSSFAQHTLQKLLECLTYDTMFQEPALDKRFKEQKDELMGIQGIARNICFEKDIVVVKKLDTCALVNLLQIIKNLPTCFKREEIHCKDEKHKESSKSCIYCNNHSHTCLKCDKTVKSSLQPYNIACNHKSKSCIYCNNYLHDKPVKSSLQPYNIGCNHKSKECKNKAIKNCNIYKNACCKDCQLCWYCFVAKCYPINLHPVRNMDEFIEMVVENDEKICPKQELRIALSILLKFRNIVGHLSNEACLEMDRGTYTNKKEHLSDKTWKWLDKTYCYAIEVVLRYLYNAQYIEENELAGKKKLLVNISACQTNDDLLNEYGVEIERYLEVLQEIGSDVKVMKLYVKETYLFVKETNLHVKETNLCVKETNLYVKEMGLDLQKLKSAAMQSLIIKITFSTVNNDRRFNSLHNLEHLDEAFKRALNEFFPHNSHKVFLQSVEEGNYLTDPKSIIMQIKINPTSNEYDLTAYEEIFGSESKELWKELEGVLLANIENATFSCTSWELGCIIINVHISKISGDKWTTKELQQVEMKLPQICAQFKKVQKDLDCECKVLEPVTEKRNVEILIFKIDPLSEEFEETMLDLDLLILRFAYWLGKSQTNRSEDNTPKLPIQARRPCYFNTSTPLHLPRRHLILQPLLQQQQKQISRFHKPSLLQQQLHQHQMLPLIPQAKQQEAQCLQKLQRRLQPSAYYRRTNRELIRPIIPGMSQHIHAVTCQSPRQLQTVFEAKDGLAVIRPGIRPDPVDSISKTGNKIVAKIDLTDGTEYGIESVRLVSRHKKALGLIKSCKVSSSESEDDDLGSDDDEVYGDFEDLETGEIMDGEKEEKSDQSSGEEESDNEMEGDDGAPKKKKKKGRCKERKFEENI